MDKCWLLSATYTELHSAQVYLCTILEWSDLGTQSLAVITFLFFLSLSSKIVYKFTCAGCISVYAGETSRHLSTRVREHLFCDKNCYVCKLFKSSCCYREACEEKISAVQDSANTAYKLKIKEALHIMWEVPNLCKQLNHYKILLNF